jgi:hypothetical protein
VGFAVVLAQGWNVGSSYGVRQLVDIEMAGVRLTAEIRDKAINNACVRWILESEHRVCPSE